VTLVSHWVKGERLRNPVTGEYEAPDEHRMTEIEKLVMPQGEDRKEFRRGLISAVGAFRLDHPEATSIDYPGIFPDLFRRLRDHFFEERKRQLRRSREDVLRYLSDERGTLDEKACRRVEDTLRNLRDRYGYCEACAQDAVLFLLRRRYEG
jgi:predicted Ser/Thr protein kinase